MAILLRHLLDNGEDAQSVRTWLDPSDKQDVVVMYKLLAALATLQKADTNLGVLYCITRDALRVFGSICSAFLEVYTSVQLSLREQLVKPALFHI